MLSDNLIFYFLFLFTGAVLAIMIAAVRAVTSRLYITLHIWFFLHICTIKGQS